MWRCGAKGPIDGCTRPSYHASMIEEGIGVKKIMLSGDNWLDLPHWLAPLLLAVPLIFDDGRIDGRKKNKKHHIGVAMDILVGITCLLRFVVHGLEWSIKGEL
jgi:hypothetical protein